MIDLIAGVTPPLQRSWERAFIGQAEAAIECDPTHDPGIEKLLTGEASRMVSDTVMNAEGYRSAPEDSVDFAAEPSWITKFDGPAVDTGGRLEDASQTSRLRPPVRRQL